MPLPGWRYLLITITLSALCAVHLGAQQMTTQAPPATPAPSAALPDDPAQISFPDARPVPPPAADSPVIESKGPQSYRAGIYTLDQEVVITYRDRRVEAGHIVYDSNTGDLTLTGGVQITAGSGQGVDQERIQASHGTYNLQTETGRFYDVEGTYGLKATPSTRRAVFTTTSPFRFSGRVLIKTGPRNYDIYDGTVTSCELPDPDWILSAGHIALEEDTAKARNAIFRLFNVPLLFLPYVTHPAQADARQTGFLIPTIGESSTKGIVLGEQIYFALNRSLDLTVGADYYSSIGWAQNAAVRYRGAGFTFANLHYSGVIDRRTGSANQGGEEVVLASRHDFGPGTRAATNVDYLSSYVYREAFSNTFNQAVTSDVVSTAYITHQWNGFEAAGLADRYQGIKVVGTPVTAQQEVHIFHAPSLSFTGTDHLVPGTGSRVSNGLELQWNGGAAGLKRTQPNFETGGIIERFDLHPQASYPIALSGWHLLPEAGLRETFYSRSRKTAALPGQPPEQSEASTSRFDGEFSLGIRPPVITRTFAPLHLTRLLGTEVRHTVEPEITYRLVDGVDNFRNILRFDAVDVVSNTSELEYGVTQRLFRRPAKGTSGTCATAEVAHAPGFSSDAPQSSEDDPEQPDPGAAVASDPNHCPSEELISWRLTQRYFFDKTFGGSIANGRRNIFTTTLDLSGVAFLTEPRDISPLISRLRFRTSAHSDIEWDFDLDTGARKFNSSNVFVDLHQGNSFAALSYARLDAPGRFYTENPTPTTGVASTNGVTTAISDFNQLRVLLGYGNPVKPGLSIAGNAGIDLKSLYGATQQTTSPTGVTASRTVYPALLQYATVQASYNWNCCGLAVEYRKFELGSVRNEGTYRFNFTLANIGAAGNLRRAERLF